MRHRRDTTTLRGRRAITVASLVIFLGIVSLLATAAAGIVATWSQ